MILTSIEQPSEKASEIALPSNDLISSAVTAILFLQLTACAFHLPGPLAV